MSTHLWCEDSGAGFTFWHEIFQTLYPDIIVETKINNSRLRKAAGKITNDGNTYYILIDSSADNADVLRELDGLKRNIADKDNVRIVGIHSFEFTLLSFALLVQWIFAEESKLKNDRQSLLQARKIFTELIIHGGTAEDLSELKKLFPYAKTHNSEQIAAELLYQITRNTGFETSKGKLGECFIIDCCQSDLKQTDNLCGLNTERLKADEKKKLLVSQSPLRDAFEKVGLL